MQAIKRCYSCIVIQYELTESVFLKQLTKVLRDLSMIQTKIFKFLSIVSIGFNLKHTELM